MALVQKYVCDHCGGDIPDGSGRVRVEFYSDEIHDASAEEIADLQAYVLEPSHLARFDFHDGCAQVAKEAWSDLNAGRMEVRGG